TALATVPATRAPYGCNLARYTKRRRLPPYEDRSQGVEYAPLDRLLAESDAVSVHAPQSADTHHLIGEEQLRRMKPTAYLINTSRGPPVDEAALVRALRGGWIAGAGLGVDEHDPRA